MTNPLLLCSLKTLRNLLISTEENKEVRLTYQFLIIIYKQAIINTPKYLTYLTNILTHQNQTLRIEACWTLTDISSTSSHIDLLINTQGCISTLMSLIPQDPIEEVISFDLLPLNITDKTRSCFSPF